MSNSTGWDTESFAVKCIVDERSDTNSACIIEKHRLSGCTICGSLSEISTEVIAINDVSDEGEDTLGDTSTVRIEELCGGAGIVTEVFATISSVFQRSRAGLNTRTIPVEILAISTRIIAVGSVLSDILNKGQVTVCTRTIQI